MKTFLAILGMALLAVTVAAYAWAAPTVNCYDPGGPAGDFPHIRCNAGLIGNPLQGLLDDQDVASTLAIGAASAQYVLPAGGDPYIVCARGNRVFVECGIAGVVATTAVGGYVFSVPDGACIGPVRLTGPNCAYIGTVAVGAVEFLHIVP